MCGGLQTTRVVTTTTTWGGVGAEDAEDPFDIPDPTSLDDMLGLHRHGNVDLRDNGLLLAWLFIYVVLSEM